MDAGFDTFVSAAEWINRKCAAAGSERNFDVIAADLLAATQRQLFRSQQSLHEVANHLPHIGASIVREVPHGRSATSSLISDIDSLEHTLSATSSSSSEMVQRIKAIETVKNRMVLTNRSLENQDNWDALITNIKDVVGGGDLDVIIGRVVALQKCFVSLGDAVNHEERRRQLDEVKNHIETVMIPRLVTSLGNLEPWKGGSGGKNQGSEGEILRLTNVFAAMERKETVQRVIRECRLRVFVKHWDNLSRTMEKEPSEASFDECLKTFYDDLLTSWHTQFPVFAAVFPHPAESLLQLYTAVLTEVNPSITALFDKWWKPSNSPTLAQDFLSSMLELKRAQDIFCRSIETEYQHSFSMVEKGPSHKSPVDHQADGGQSEEFVGFLRAARAAFDGWSEKYSDAERTIIIAEVEKVILHGKEKEKSLQTLSGTASRLGAVFYAGVIRSFQLTGGEGLEKMVEIVEHAVQEHLKRVSDFTADLRRNGSLEASRAAVNTVEGSYGVLSDLVKILHHFGDLRMQLDNIVESLRQIGHHGLETSYQTFSPVADIINQSANSLFNDFLSIILLPVDDLLMNLEALATWTTSTSKDGIEIPSFGLDPQEYITRIGNYLLTLPQLMDPALSSESPIMRVLKLMVNFPGIATPDDSISMAEAVIQAVIYSAMEKVTNSLTKVRHLTNSGVRQLVCDLRYLQNVVEDFAVPLTTNFSGLTSLLSCSLEEWHLRAEQYPSNIVTFTARARNMDQM